MMPASIHVSLAKQFIFIRSLNQNLKFTTTRRLRQNTQKSLRQMRQNFSSYTFHQNLRQKIVQNGYLQNAAKGV